MGSLDRRAKVGFCVALMGIMGLGAALRLWMLESQLLLDDEWHGINYVIGQPLAYVFTHQGLGANSIPMNGCFFTAWAGPRCGFVFLLLSRASRP